LNFIRGAARDVEKEDGMIFVRYPNVFVFPLAMFLFGGTAGSLWAQRSPADNHVVYYQQLLKRNSQNAKAYLGLGDALIRKARETGDPTYFNRAEEALKRFLELAPENATALRHLAYVFYSRHEFAPAAIHARRALELNPDDGDTLGVLGDALLEVGDYRQAEEAYEKMMVERDASLYSLSRLAGLKSLRGDSSGAIEDLKNAVARGKETRQPAESVAWAEWQLGSDYFSLGNLPEAESQYQQALKTYPDYYRAVAGLAQVRAAQKRYDEAIALYQRAIGTLPMPEYVAALGDIYTKVGKREEARKQYELVEFIGKLSASNQALYNRELAYFYADRDVKPAEGLALAKRELEYRRDIYAFDVLAWNLFRNGKLEEARDAIIEALKLDTQDAKIFYHAGMIYHRLGDQAQAREYLNRALKINRYFHIRFADDAARLLTEIENAQAEIAARQASDAR
jgi:tetratricopeptide (TPR) repeat protein